MRWLIHYTRCFFHYARKLSRYTRYYLFAGDFSVICGAFLIMCGGLFIRRGAIFHYIHGTSFSLDLKRGQLRKEVKMAATMDKLDIVARILKNSV